MIKRTCPSLSKLGIGPMSSEIIEAAFRCAQRKRKALMLIPSKNQIDRDGGYVNNWTTREFMARIRSLRRKYKRARIYICRDHCGPGFSNDDIRGVYKTFDSDIENGFDLIHVDFSKLKGRHVDILEESKKAITYIRKKNPKVLIEIGTDENTGAFSDDLSRIKKEMEFFTEIAPIQYFVCQTGSLIKEFNQRGKLNIRFIKKVRKIADQYGFCLKEHNADYLNKKEIKLRKGLLDALNVAPQYGVIQTQLTLEKCLLYGIDCNDFLHDSYNSKRWQKWLDCNKPSNKFLCAVIAGHYNFAKDSYKRIYAQISRHEDFKETIISEMIKNFEIYLDNL